MTISKLLKATVPLLIALLLVSIAAASALATDDIGELGWMVGSWASESDGQTAEEFWSDARGGLMLGMHRDVSKDGKPFYEYLRIESRPAGIYYVAVPSGSTATDFKLVESSRMKAVFSNSKHDWPKRITYWREPDDKLCARADAGPGSHVAGWCWDLIRPASAGAAAPEE